MKAFYIPGAALLALMGLTIMPLQANAQRVQPRPREVNHRLENQHDRIHQGVKSGQLTQAEANRLRYRAGKARYEARRDRAAQGGHLTRKEYKRLNHELNHDSKAIYRAKHNKRNR